jgi:sodium borate transporter 11
MFGTLWLANSFNSFDRTPYLSTRKREIIKDYALAIAVLIFSFIGSYLFADIKLDVFEFGEFAGLHVAQMSKLSAGVMATACLLGFMASVLFYIDQNICGAMVNNAPYRLKKGNYFHLDLLVLAILNTFLSLTGLPWMHGKLPHSHLHSKALADYEERVDEGHIHQMIVNIRETRMTGVLVSILVALSLLAVPYPLSYIPLPVLSGVFLYTALSEFKSNSMIERVCLLFTEQVAYPPNHYIRRCPQRKIHLFTLTQLVQLAVVSFIGFYPNPYVNMAFPLAVATFVPIRGLFLPKLIDSKYLHSLDRASLE